MDIRSVDLNLLLVFHAMVEHRSVTRAADAVGLSQPAMSAAVARLRVLFDDRLFVYEGNEMRPTPHATNLAVPIRRVIDMVGSDILRTTAFDPATTQRRFTLALPDIAEVSLLPKLLAHFAVHAPQASLQTLAMPRHAAAESLESGAAELAVGFFPDLNKAGFFQQKLFDSALVCIVRSAHPTIGRAITLEAYLAASHVVVRPEGRGHVFDQFLQERGLARRIALETSHYMSLLPIIASTDLIATLPEDMASFCAGHADIRILAVPIEAPALPVHQFWHRRFHKDPANAWLRASLQELFGARGRE